MQAFFFYRKSRYVSPVRKHRSQPRLQLPRLHRLQPRFSANTATAVNNNYSPQSLNSTYLGASTTPAATQRKLSPGEGSFAVNPSGGHHGVKPPIGPAAATVAFHLPQPSAFVAPASDHVPPGHVPLLMGCPSLRRPRRPLHGSNESGMFSPATAGRRSSGRGCQLCCGSASFCKPCRSFARDCELWVTIRCRALGGYATTRTTII